jgi:hypothetical protein
MTSKAIGTPCNSTNYTEIGEVKSKVVRQIKDMGGGNPRPQSPMDCIVGVVGVCKGCARAM